MLENRSFDHLLGWPDVQGRKVPFNPSNLALGYAPVFELTSPDAYQTVPDPCHEFPAVTLQLFGREDPPPGAGPTNDGFVLSYSQTLDDEGHAIGPEHGRMILGCMSPSAVPVIRRLANEFAVCDNWFASVPGPTWPNRDFIHAGTSMGHVDSPGHGQMAWGYPHQRTIYHNLKDAGRTWKVYYHDFPQVFWFRDLVQYKDTNFAKFDQFDAEAQTGDFPNYSFIEPRYFNAIGMGANDGHPPHDVREAEALTASVYNSLRQSPHWKSTLFVLVYDEHGGFYDHVAPPAAVRPDERESKSPPFAFDRLGVRVPALLISPWVGKKKIDSTLYDHTSILAFLKKHFGLADFLHHRDEVAKTFESNFLPAPRDDCPMTIDVPLANGPLLASAVRQQTDMARRPLSDFQKSLVALSASLDHPRCQHEAAEFVQERMRELKPSKPASSKAKPRARKARSGRRSVRKRR
jgi:phospholipase C